MNERILWVEDEKYAFNSVLSLLKNAGIKADVAKSAYDGYIAIQGSFPPNVPYNLLVIDIIIPADETDEHEDITSKWSKEEYPGIGLIKCIREDLKVDLPMIIYSIVPDPIQDYHLEKYNILEAFLKFSTTSIQLRDSIVKILHSS
jgi:hypothetical protein